MPTPRRGFTLIEVIIAISLTAVVIGIYTAVLASTFFLRRTQYDLQAQSLVQEELETLGALPFDELLTRSNGNLLGVSIQRGLWTVNASASAVSLPNILELGTAQSAVTGETGIAITPGDYRDAVTFKASLKALPASPANWGAGIALRYRDAENYYRFRFTSGGLAFDKVVHGTATTLWSQGGTYAKDTWYALEVVASANSFTLKKNGITLATVTDGTFLTGDLAVFSMNGALVQADSASAVDADGTATWDFDSDTVGAIPEAWRRLSALDLPSGGATLTVAQYAGSADAKTATVTVTWKDGNANRTVNGSTLYVRQFKQ